MRFAVNIALLFTEVPFLERFAAAARAGFRAVEFWWPSAADRDAVEAAVRDAGVEVVRFALDGGDLDRGDQGLLCLPEREERFRASALEGLELAGRLRCGMVNALVGSARPGLGRDEQLAHGRRVLAWLADQAAPRGIDVLIEAASTRDKAGYLVTTTAEALAFTGAVARPNVRLLYDVYHMQRMEGDLTATIRRCVGEIAHVQVADVPDRHEPGTGEINFAYLFRALDAAGYRGHVGLEYRPSTTTAESLRWLPTALRGRDVRREDLARLRL
jgi:hydroxypyruvate isomerase